MLVVRWVAVCSKNDGAEGNLSNPDGQVDQLVGGDGDS